MRSSFRALSAADEPNKDELWRVSSGSAAILGLDQIRMDAPPTAAYLLIGERCRRDCAFCAQGRQSRSEAARLSRVAWPQFPAETIAKALGRVHTTQDIGRVCFQVTVCDDYTARARRAVETVVCESPLPVCVSIVPRTLEDVSLLLSAGADRVTIALDAATESVFRETKGGSWTHVLSLLEQASDQHPGHIGTHLIVGLGETEHEMASLIQRLVEKQITIGLFAFTPVRGTALSSASPPSLDHYRRIQVAHWLIASEASHVRDLSFDGQGQIVDYGIPKKGLREVLRDGRAFQTTGCASCNRPYYNEPPGGPIYNYPRPLERDEAEQEILALINGLRHEKAGTCDTVSPLA